MKFTQSHTFHSWHVTYSRLLKRGFSSSQVVWLGRFRYLALYTVLKGSILLVVGMLSMRAGSLQSSSTFHLTSGFWMIVLLGMMTCALVVIAGLAMASENRPRAMGLVLLGASDVCELSAVLYATLSGNPALLLMILVLVSCTTPILLERIGRSAKSFLVSTSQLEHMKNETDLLLLQVSENLVQAIERERISLKREMHDGLLQELCALSLQMSVMIRRKSEEGALQLNTADVKKLETALRRAVTETRHVMADIQSTKRALETIDTLQLPIVIPKVPGNAQSN